MSSDFYPKNESWTQTLWGCGACWALRLHWSGQQGLLPSVSPTLLSSQELCRLAHGWPQRAADSQTQPFKRLQAATSFGGQEVSKILKSSWAQGLLFREHPGRKAWMQFSWAEPFEWLGRVLEFNCTWLKGVNLICFWYPKYYGYFSPKTLLLEKEKQKIKKK